MTGHRAIKVQIMRTIAMIIITTLFVTGSAEAALAAKVDAQEATAWRKVAETIPLGSKVKVQTIEGKRITGTLMRVDDTAVIVKRSTRRPEPALSIRYDDVSSIEREQHGGGGASFGKALAIAGATGGAIVLSLFLLAMQLD